MGCLDFLLDYLAAELVWRFLFPWFEPESDVHVLPYAVLAVIAGFIGAGCWI